MTKYIVESNIDFYLELSKFDSGDVDELNNTCLITNMPLTDRNVKLNCGHMFNYIPLFNDIRNHKTKFNNMESSAGTLKLNQIRCPYCRNIQEGVLPYYEDLGVQLMNGVNMYDPKMNIYGDYTKCQFITDNSEFNPNQPEDPITNIKSYPCNCYGSKIVIVGVPNDNEWGDKKSYCRAHKKIVIRNYKKAEILKVKAEAKKAKDQANEEAKKAKEEAKKAKEEAKKAKAEAKGTPLVNASTPLPKCIAILKSGVNKGTECGCVAISGVYCKRHMPS